MPTSASSGTRGRAGSSSIAATSRRPSACRALIDGLEAALGRRLLVTTDHEGGRIIMLGARRDDLPRQPRRGHRGRGRLREAAGADRGARAAAPRRGRELRPGASTCSPSATARISASAPTARTPSWSRASAPRASSGHAGGRRLRLRQALSRQGPRAGRRAPRPARHRLRLGRHARRAPRAVHGGDGGGRGLPHDLASALSESRSRAAHARPRSRA